MYAWWADSDHNSEAKDSDEAVFYELPVPVSATRKAVGVPASEPSITVPVYTFRASEAGRHSYRNETPYDCVLQPFFINLSKSEAADPVAVREAITRGYTRLARLESRSDMWVPSGSRQAAVVLSPVDDDDHVTEIHLEGDKTRVVEVSSRSPDTSMDVDGAPSGGISLLHRNNGSTTSLSDAGSVRSIKGGKLVPRGDLFKAHVADASSSDGSTSFNFAKAKDPVVPFFKGTPSTASASWSQLENRRKAKKTMFGHLTTGLKSIVGANYASDDEHSPPASPIPQPLVVRPGEGIFCEWSSKVYNEFFETTASWHDDEVIDPAIEKELAKKKEGRAISIEDCLDEFSKEETLGQDDLWYCPQVSALASFES